MKADYSKEDIIRALIEVGVEKGDNIFIHSNIGFFGQLEDASSPDAYYTIFKEALFSVVGKEGTIVVPTFSYTFCKGNIFDTENTPGVCGFFSEMVRKDPESIRSDDANFSIAAIGKNAGYFTKDAPEHSFGPNCFWERFMKSNGKFCNFNFDAGSTFIHYVEKTLRVPYRYDKAFPGKSIINGKEEDRVFYHFVYDLNKPNNGPEFTKFHKKAMDSGLVKTADLGKGQVVLISAKDTFELIKSELPKNTAFLIKGDRVED